MLVEHGFPHHIRYAVQTGHQEELNQEQRVRTEDETS